MKNKTKNKLLALGLGIIAISGVILPFSYWPGIDSKGITGERKYDRYESTSQAR